jgi:hypothetical protein
VFQFGLKKELRLATTDLSSQFMNETQEIEAALGMNKEEANERLTTVT